MPERIDFKQLARDVDIVEVAEYIGLKLFRKGSDIRARCPACETANDRAIQLFEETNTFRCHVAEQSGDCIALLAHAKGYQGMYRAAKELADRFGTPDGARPSATPPHKTEGRTAAAQPPPPKPFDPETFASRLVYSPEVEALGVAEDDAARLGIGWHPQRKFVYLPVRNPDGSFAGFVGVRDASAVKLPPQWLSSNVVPLKKRA